MKPSKNDSGSASNRSIGESMSANVGDKSKAVVPVNEEDALKDLILTNRMLAHQLNNLLTTILANTQLMLLVVNDEELKPYLEALQDAARGAGAMVREFQGSVKALAGLSPPQK